MHIVKHKDMRFLLVESKYIKMIEIIGDTIEKLIKNLEDESNDVAKEEIINQLEQIRNFCDSL